MGFLHRIFFPKKNNQSIEWFMAEKKWFMFSGISKGFDPFMFSQCWVLNGLWLKKGQKMGQNPLKFLDVKHESKMNQNLAIFLLDDDGCPSP